MRIAVAGASGLIGTALVRRLRNEGETPIVLVRRASRDGIPWDPAGGQLDPAALEGFDALICLSGESLSGGRWTAAKKEAIRNSRVGAVGLLARALASMPHPPRSLLCASAVGYYGCGSDDVERTESGAPGDDFLARVCIDWERAADPAREAGLRVVHFRFGVVLAKEGGALAQMLTPFWLGLGGVMGSGRQYLSWLTLEEAVNIIVFALRRDDVNGPLNVVAPNPVTNAEFTRALGRVLRRPTILHVPAFAVRAIFGEMGELLLLGGVRAVPKALQTLGYEFLSPELDGALRRVLAGS